jgi:hypothetical protein
MFMRVSLHRKKMIGGLSRILPGLTYCPAVQARSPSWAVRAGVEVGFFDLLLAYGLADFLLSGDLLGAQADPLHRDGFLFHHRTLGSQGNFMLCLADRLARQRGIAVSVGNLWGVRSAPSL